MNPLLRMLREARDKAHIMEEGFDFHWECLFKGHADPDEQMTLDDLDRKSAVCAKAKAQIQKIIDDLMKEAYQ